MEQIELKDGTVRDIYKIENSIHVTPAILQVSFLNEDIVEMEELFKDANKTESLYLCDSSGGIMAVFKGYTELSSITKAVNQITGYTTEEIGEDGSIKKESEPVYGDIITIRLTQADMKKQIQALTDKNAELESLLSSLNETQTIQDGAILEIAEMLGAEDTQVPEGGEVL